MHGYTFGRILMIMVDNRLTGQLRHTHDTVGMVHTVFFYTVDRRIYIAARTVEVRGMHMNDQRFAADMLGMYARRISQPIVGMNNIILLLTGYDSCHNGIIIDLIMKIVRITTGKLNTSQVIGLPITEISINMVAQSVILLRRHFIAQTLLDIVIINITPNNRSFTQTDNIHETFVLISPRFWDTKGNLHVWLLGQTCCNAVAGSSESAQNMGREFPSEH